MCGIAGIIGTRTEVTRERLQSLASSLAHRGPDDMGMELLPTRVEDHLVGFVHRRLAIIDLSPGGHQPMEDPATGNWITFNGEIYNYQELTRTLKSAGHTFRSQSDTEVMLKAYAEWGGACVERMRGMFAFAIWDRAREELVLAVDRFGIKPLYYTANDGRLAFASEVRALLHAGLAPRDIEPLAIESFLAYGTVQAPLTMIANVHAVLPGHILTYAVSTGTHRVEPYWTPHAESVCVHGSTKDALLDSVRHHLIADVPVALFLSGGIDSSALAIFVHEIAGRALDSFSVTFAEHAFAEGVYAKKIGEQFCARHHEIELSDSDLRGLLPKALVAMDQPTVDGVNVFVISKAVCDAGMTVVLSGQGGDEVFGGYSTFPRMSRMRAYSDSLRRVMRPPYRSAASVVRWGDGLRGRTSIIESKLEQLLGSDGSPFAAYGILRQLFGPMARTHLLGRRPATHALDNGVPVAVADRLRQASRTLDAFQSTSLFELRGYLANTLLRDGDVMSMAHALEVRVPYLDHELLEHVWGISEREKVDTRLPKALLLRQVLNTIPRAIYDRTKMGFTFPWEVWLRGSLRPELDELFADAHGIVWSFLNRETCLHLWRAFLDRKPGVTWSRIWALYVFATWVHATLGSIDPRTTVSDAACVVQGSRRSRS